MLTIRLFSVNELSNAQLGYSINSDGNSLIGEENGDWKENWFVIGKLCEDLCGDPIFVDDD